jgi:hypothetical protein
MVLVLGAFVATALAVIVKTVTSAQFREIWQSEEGGTCPWRGGLDD